jgi:hypothetical protein
MYTVIRKIHLYSGLIIVIFLMMYFVSGFIMVHRPWFTTPPPPPITRTATLQSTGGQTPQQIAAAVQKQLQLPGRIQFPQTQPDNLVRFWVNHPGTMTRVDVSTKGKRIDLTTQRVGLVGTLIMLHKVCGYDAEPLFDAYAFFCDLAGVSMILFPITGIYLWWKTARNHLWGTLCLVASCAFAAGIMLYLACAR